MVWCDKVSESVEILKVGGKRSSCIAHDDTVQMIRSEQQAKEDGKLWGEELQVLNLLLKGKYRVTKIWNCCPINNIEDDIQYALIISLFF